MKELKELMEWVKHKVKRLIFIVEEGRIIDALNVMAVELGRQDEVLGYPCEDDLEIKF